MTRQINRSVCERCKREKALQAFPEIALDPRSLSEYATVEPGQTRRDTVCLACRGDEKRRQSREKVAAERGLTVTQLQERKQTAGLGVVIAEVAAHVTPQAAQPTPAPQPTQPDLTDIADWRASGSPGAFRYGSLLIVPRADGYSFLTRPAGVGPSAHVPADLVEYLARVMAGLKPDMPMRGIVYA
jgi:hypothetical protein